MMRMLLYALLALQVASGDPFAGLRQEWARDLHDKKIEASVALYAADATFIQPDGTRVEGTAAILAMYKNITTMFDSDLTFTSKRVEVSGELAVDSGTYTESLVARATGKPMHSSGSYLTEYRREKDGNWKIVEQVWTGTITQ